MKIIVFKEVEETVEKYDIVTFDKNINKYIKANNENFIGVVNSIFTSENKNMASISFNGIQQVKLSRDSEIEGGFLSVENGKAYMDNSSTRKSFIYPVNVDDDSVSTDENGQNYLAQNKVVYIQLY